MRIMRDESAVTLPERQEDDRLDDGELEHRIVGRQQVLGGEVEEEQRVQGQRDRHVVNDGHVQVTRLGAASEKSSN